MMDSVGRVAFVIDQYDEEEVAELLDELGIMYEVEAY